MVNENEAKRLLIVDDDEMNREILANIFEDVYESDFAADGEEGLKMIVDNQQRYCAILLDVMMPKMDGLTVLEELKKDDIAAVIPVFLITAERSNNVMRKGYELGVMDIIEKPVIPYVIRRRIMSVVELFESRKQLARRVEFQNWELLEKAKEIIALNEGLIEALATAIEFRDGESGHHVKRIHDITHCLLSQTSLGNGLTAKEIDDISLASIMHDVGKIAIPDAILCKPGKLTAEEYAIMKEHTIKGAELLQSIPVLKNTKVYEYAFDIARHHHERYDGKGYPDGLKGKQISLWAQVVSLADVYDALCSKRVYKQAFSFDDAVKMIVTGECGTFSPDLLAAFLQVEPQIRKIYDKYKEV